MNVDIKYIDVEPTKEDKELINKFISQLKKNYPLENDITILFQKNRTGKMTTGSRTNKHKLKLVIRLVYSLVQQ